MIEVKTSSNYKNEWERLGNDLLSMLHRRPEKTGIVELRYSSGPEHIHYEIQLFELETTLGESAIYTISFEPQGMSEGGDFAALNAEQKYLVTESRQFWDTYNKE